MKYLILLAIRKNSLNIRVKAPTTGETSTFRGDATKCLHFMLMPVARVGYALEL